MSELGHGPPMKAIPYGKFGSPLMETTFLACGVPGRVLDEDEDVEEVEEDTDGGAEEVVGTWRDSRDLLLEL